MSSPTTPGSAALSLTERRKAETRMEIARAAAGLFMRQGLRATRAEDIARAAGIAPRTFYRYFAGKEEAVAPLYAAGAERWAAAVREAPAGIPVPEVLEQAVRHTLTPGTGVSSESWTFVRTLIRLTESSPALRKVWTQVCHASERTLLGVLEERLGSGPRRGGPEDSAVSAVSPVAGEPGAARGSAVPKDSAAAQDSAVPPDLVPPDVPDNVADLPSASPELRFAAVVASAVVRVAVETWAAGDAPAEGTDGPAALALRNLEALRDFPWEAAAG